MLLPVGGSCVEQQNTMSSFAFEEAGELRGTAGDKIPCRAAGVRGVLSPNIFLCRIQKEKAEKVF